MSKEHEIIVYKDTVFFNFTLPGEEETKQVSRELTLVWEDTLDKFFEQYNPQMPYKINPFKNEKEKDRFISHLEHENDEIIDDVQEEISRKMKFSFDYTSPTHED